MKKLLLFTLFTLFTTSLFGQGVVSLVWDPNSESDLAGYKVYWGTTPRTYGTPTTIGLVTTFTTPTLSPGRYYFSVTARNTAGLESGYSNEVSAIITAIGPIEPFNLAPPITVNITRYTANIAWITDVPTNGLVEYGLTPANLSMNQSLAAFTTDHVINLTNLRGATLYYYRVTSRDSNNIVVVSSVGSFNTK